MDAKGVNTVAGATHALRIHAQGVPPQNFSTEQRGPPFEVRQGLQPGLVEPALSGRKHVVSVSLMLMNQGLKEFPMPVDITIPSVGESITEGTLSRWFKKDGD